MSNQPSLTSNIAYLCLIFALIVIPRALQRFRLPAPLSSFGLGMFAAWLLGAEYHDATLTLLATLGISSLFLFAGLEIDLQSLRRGRWPLLCHLLLRSLTLGAVTWAGMRYFGYAWNTAALIALALLTPSTGFILESLPRLGLNEDERRWVTLKAMGGEILALLVLFVVLQADSAPHLAASSLAIVAMIFGIPLLFRCLVRLVVPYAPGAEFSLLVMVGLVAAYLTDQLGVNYLVGAFLAGFIARLLRRRLPTLASKENLHAIQLFASFFVPFYFFYAGMGVPSAALTWRSLQWGLILTAAVLPARIASLWLQRRIVHGESAAVSLKVATALSPTLIFTLVLAAILRERFHIADALYGGLLVYAAMSTIVASLPLSKQADFSLDVSQVPVETEPVESMGGE
ncbi:MAG TPA: cation:proton antiporter [Steroidobacteraceae bacterium]|nr:cation:proton antiporter [Steroidobacteraceae bacterium]